MNGANLKTLGVGCDVLVVGYICYNGVNKDGDKLKVGMHGDVLTMEYNY